MKTAKLPTTADSSSNRRSQPARQARTNPPRTSANLGRSNGGRDSISGSTTDQPIDIFPAITYFADVMTALPKELVRHFTLLKEVDAKLCAPEEQLFKFVAETINARSPEALQHHGALSVAAPSSAPMSAQNSSSGLVPNGGALPPPSTTESVNTASAVFDPANIPRRQLFRQTALKIQEMLVSLEEKNHVIGTANEALHKQLARIENVWPHLENEFSDEAKWGSTMHWAYPENRTGKSQPERARRDGAAAISAAAQALADEAAARSDARKQAVQAKKNQKNQHQESDFDDHDHRNHKNEGGKKTGQGKVRKTAAAAAAAAAAAESNNVGLGISTTATTNGNPPSKKRKVEATTNGASTAERAMSTVFGANAPKIKAVPTGDAPIPDGPKKRKALPSSSTQAKKKLVPHSCFIDGHRRADANFRLPRNGITNTPSATSSPVITPLPESKGPARASPTPNATSRPTTSRARQNSIQSGPDNGKSRTTPVAAAKPNGVQPAVQEIAPPPAIPRASSDSRSVKEPNVPTKSDPPKKDAEKPENGGGSTPVIGKKETKTEERERRKSESTPPAPPSTTTVTTKSGRASKPSTPAMATFQEAARPRSSRNSESINNKKNQKKGNPTPQALAPPVVDDDLTSGEGDIDVDEPTYCYCNSVSYGEMVACDAAECEREWFHLACVGLKVAPAEKSTFCRHPLYGKV